MKARIRYMSLFRYAAGASVPYLLALSSTGCPESAPVQGRSDTPIERVGSKQSPLYVASTKIWSSPRISVCWETSGKTTEKAWIRDAIRNTWEAESAVTFTGWAMCSGGGANLRVKVVNLGAFTVDLGTDLNNVL